MDLASGIEHPQTTSVGIYTLSRRLRLDADQGLRHAVYAAGYPTVWAKAREYSTRNSRFLAAIAEAHAARFLWDSD